MATRAKKKSTGSRGQGRGNSTGARRSATRTRSRKPARGTAARAKPGNARRGTGRGRGRGRGTGTAGVSRQQDAIALLRTEHEQVSKLFDEFERATHARGGNGSARKSQLATEICRQLESHTAVEEEIFYPAVAAAINDDELIPEATVEHQSAKELIAKIERMEPEDELFDATVMVLGEYVRHHVKEEQNELFPKAKRSGIDLVGLGQQMRDWRARATM